MFYARNAPHDGIIGRVHCMHHEGGTNMNCWACVLRVGDLSMDRVVFCDFGDGAWNAPYLG